MIETILAPLSAIVAFVPSFLAFVAILFVGRYVVRFALGFVERSEAVLSQERLGFDLSNVVGAVMRFFVWYFALLQLNIDLFFIIDFVLGLASNLVLLAGAGLALAFALSKEGQKRTNDIIKKLVS